MNVSGVNFVSSGSMNATTNGTNPLQGASVGDRASFFSNQHNATIEGTLSKLGEMTSNILDDMGQMWNVPNMMIMISSKDDDDEERTTIIMAGSNPFGGMGSEQFANLMQEFSNFNQELAARNGFGSYLNMVKKAETQVGPSSTLPAANSMPYVAPSGAGAATAYQSGSEAGNGQSQGGSGAPVQSAPMGGAAAGGAA